MTAVAAVGAAANLGRIGGVPDSDADDGVAFAGIVDGTAAQTIAAQNMGALQ